MTAVSADLLQLAIVEETVPGTTPTTPTFLVLPVTSESLAGNASTQTSNTLNPSRQVTDSILTNLETGGDIAIEFTLNAAVKLLLGSAMAYVFVPADGTPFPVPPANAPGVSPMGADIGNPDNNGAKRTFTAEVRFPDPINAGQYLYQRFTNCGVDTFSITADPENPVTASFTVMGGVPSTDTAIIAGATYTPAGDPDYFRGPDFLTLQFGSLTGALPCMSAFTLNLANNMRGQKCLGTLGNKDILLGTADPNGSGEVYYTDNDLLDALFAQTAFAFTMEMVSNGGDYFAVAMPRCKQTNDVVAATGQNTDVVNDLSFQGSYDTTQSTSLRMWYEEA